MNAVTVDSFAGLVAQALERMAFVLAEPSPLTPGELLATSAAHAIVQIDTATSALLSVSATSGMVREIAAGMLGLEAEEIDVDEHAAATVAELANVLGGELTMLLTAGDEPSRLGLPREASSAEVETLLDGAGDGFRIALGSDSGALLIVVRHGA
jgi:CheY-specific phosphatase CheX